jgi:putative pyruvate formate lyase activating enzyme
MRFIAEDISLNTYVNIMDQYYPCGNPPLGSPLERRLHREEFDAAVRGAREAGLFRLDKKEKECLKWW